MRKSVWNKSNTEILVQLYPSYTNAALSQLMGIEISSIRYKAYTLGLRKDAELKNKHIINRLKADFKDKTLDELGRELKVNRKTICAWAKKLGLQRTKEDKSRILSRIRSELVHREKVRLCFGLPSKTKIKVVTNRSKIVLRSKLKKVGYIIGQTKNDISILSSTKRNLSWESKGVKLGLRFNFNIN